MEETIEVMTVNEVCETLRMGHNALYALLSSGKLKAFRNGRHWRIPKAAVQEYILENAKMNLMKN